MKTFHLPTFIVIFLLICSNWIHGQTKQTKLNQVSLENTEQFSITSKYVAGEKYIIQIGLPIGYSSS